ETAADAPGSATASASSGLPLDGVRVLELGHIIAGPFCSMLLADLGADVIKVEHPEGGDLIRGSSPVGNSSFNYVNRDKRSLTLDLKSDAALDAFFDLLDETDVVVENYAPGTAERLGIGYEQLRETHPGLVYCSIKGFNPGPYESYPALDPIAEALSGLMSVTGHEGMPPVRSGTSIADMAASFYGAIAVLGALYRRDRTGRGVEGDRAAVRVHRLDDGLLARVHRGLRRRAGADGRVTPQLGTLRRVRDGRRRVGVHRPLRRAPVDRALRGARPRPPRGRAVRHAPGPPGEPRRTHGPAPRRVRDAPRRRPRRRAARGRRPRRQGELDGRGRDRPAPAGDRLLHRGRDRRGSVAVGQRPAVPRRRQRLRPPRLDRPAEARRAHRGHPLVARLRRRRHRRASARGRGLSGRHGAGPPRRDLPRGRAAPRGVLHDGTESRGRARPRRPRRRLRTGRLPHRGRTDRRGLRRGRRGDETDGHRPRRPEGRRGRGRRRRRRHRRVRADQRATADRTAREGRGRVALARR
ncbi:CAIB/BAIF family protein, partial [Haloferax sp. BAB-2207]